MAERSEFMHEVTPPILICEELYLVLTELAAGGGRRLCARSGTNRTFEMVTSSDFPLILNCALIEPIPVI